MGIEARRSPRVTLAIPLILKYEDDVVRAQTVTVNSHGALVHSRNGFFVGAELRVTNVNSAENTRAWVVFTRESEKKGYFDVGFEFLGATTTFWGPVYRW